MAELVFFMLVLFAALACAVLVLLVPAVCLLVFTNQARAACGAGLDCCLDGGYTFDWADALGAALVIHAVTVPVIPLVEEGGEFDPIAKIGGLFILAANDVFLLCCAVTLHLSTSTALVWPDGGQLQHNSSSTASATASDNSTVRSWATREECFLGTHEPFSTALSIGRVMAWIIVGIHVCMFLSVAAQIRKDNRRDAERKRREAERKRREAERKRREAERKQHEAEQKRGDEKHQVRGGVGQSLISLIFGGKNTAPEPESKDMCRNPMRDSNPPSTAAMAAVAATAAAPEPESKDMHRNPMRESNPPSAAAASHNTASVNTVQQSTPRAPTRAPEPSATPPTSPYASEMQAAAAVARGAFGLLSWGASTIVSAVAGAAGVEEGKAQDVDGDEGDVEVGGADRMKSTT